MNLDDFRHKVRGMSPLKRAFVSAALGVGAYGVVLGTAMTAPGLTMVASLGVSLLGSMFVSSYSDPSRGTVSVLGMHMSKDSLVNIGAFFGSYIFAAPNLVGAALGLVLASANPAGIDAGPQVSMESPAAVTIEPPQIQPPTIS